MPLLAYNRNNYTDLNGTSNDFEDGLVVNGMLATSLALLLSLMAWWLYSPWDSVDVYKLVPYGESCFTVLGSSAARFTSLASTLAMLVVGRGCPRTGVKDCRCDLAAKATVVVGFAWALPYKAMVWLEIYYLFTHHISDLSTLALALPRWACDVESALNRGHLVVTLESHYVTGLMRRRIRVA